MVESFSPPIDGITAAFCETSSPSEITAAFYETSSLPEITAAFCEASEIVSLPALCYRIWLAPTYHCDSSGSYSISSPPSYSLSLSGLTSFLTRCMRPLDVFLEIPRGNLFFNNFLCFLKYRTRRPTLKNFCISSFISLVLFVSLDVSIGDLEPCHVISQSVVCNIG